MSTRVCTVTVGPLGVGIGRGAGSPQPQPPVPAPVSVPAMAPAVQPTAAGANLSRISESSPTPLGAEVTGGVTAGPDGSEWFTGSREVMSVSSTGVATGFPVIDVFGDQPAGGVGSIVSGPDGALWFTWCNPTYFDASGIGRITPAGVTQLFDVPQLGGACPPEITTSGGSLWFTGSYTGDVFRATPQSANSHLSLVVTSFPLSTELCPTNDCGDNWNAQSVTATADGEVWVLTERSNQQGNSGTVVGINPSLQDGFFVAATLPTNIATSNTAQSASDGMTVAGSTVWTTNGLDNAVFALPTAPMAPLQTFAATAHFTLHGITTGSDGAVWYMAANDDSTQFCRDNPFDPTCATYLGRMTSDGTQTASVPKIDHNLSPIASENDYGLAGGASSTIWFVDGSIDVTSTSDPTTRGALVAAQCLLSGVTVAADGHALGTCEEASVDSASSAQQGRVRAALVSVSPGLVTTVYPSPYPLSPIHGSAGSPVIGPDGNVWFVGPESDVIDGFTATYRVTPTGSFTRFPLTSIPEADSPGGARLTPVGSQNALYFPARTLLGRITTSGAVSSYPLPSGYGALSAALGPDGDIWIDASGPGKTSTSGKWMLRFDVGSGTVTGKWRYALNSGYDTSISAGPMGRLWIGDQSGHRLVSVTTAGVVHAVGAAWLCNSCGLDLTAGPDGNLWTGGGSIERLTPFGARVSIAADTAIGGVAFGPDGNLWYPSFPALVTRIDLASPAPSPAETAGGHSPVEFPTHCAVGSPVDCATGEFWHSFDDLSIPGLGGGLDFRRTYSSVEAATNGPLGHGWTDSYHQRLSTDAISGAVTVALGTGAAVSFTPGPAGTYAAPPRLLATLATNGDGTDTFTTRAGRAYRFDATTGNLLDETDRNGYRTTMAYDGSNRLVSVTDAGGRALTLSYLPDGHLGSVADQSGRTASFVYDAAGDLVTATQPNGGSWSFGYDAAHQMTTMTDPRGGITTNQYAVGRVVQQTDPAGDVTGFAYAPGSTTITDPRGLVTRDNYYAGQLISSTLDFGTASAATWLYSYDLLTRALAATSTPDGQTTTAGYDIFGDELNRSDPLGRTTRWTYDTAGDVLSITDPLGRRTSNTYDAAGNLVTTSRMLSGTEVVRTTMTYGATHPGLATTRKDPTGDVSHYSYDGDGDVLTTSDALGHTTHQAYDVIGQRISVTTPLGHKTTFEYDVNGQVTRTIDALGRVSTYGYDKEGHRVRVTDVRGRITRYTYDPLGRLTSVAHPGPAIEKWTFDGDGNRVSHTDPLGRTWHFTFDGANRLSETKDPRGQVTSYGYDNEGRRVRRTDSAGHRTLFAYDAAGERRSVTYPDHSTPSVSYTYLADGSRASMTDGSGRTSYSYDTLGRLVRATNGSKLTVAYGYDRAGDITTLTYPGGAKVLRAYDAAHRLVAVTDWAGRRTTFHYDAAGRLTTETYPNRVVARTSYDTLGRPTSISDVRGSSRLFSLSYTRNPSGAPASETHRGLAGASTTTYGYDTRERLASASGRRYTFDAASDLVGMPGITLAYDAAGEVTRRTVNGRTWTYAYDSRGDRISVTPPKHAPIHLRYDESGHLRAYGPHAAYSYNGDGLLIQQRLGTSTTSFAFDQVDGLAAVIAHGSTRFVYGPNRRPIEQVRGSTVRYLHQDAVGSTRAMTKPSGTIAATFTWSPYGSLLHHTGTESTPLGWDGEWSDSASGLVWLRARYYDPSTAQFTSRDPLADLTRLPYAYADGNPLVAVDPSGLAASGVDTKTPVQPPVVPADVCTFYSDSTRLMPTASLAEQSLALACRVDIQHLPAGQTGSDSPSTSDFLVQQVEYTAEEELKTRLLEYLGPYDVAPAFAVVSGFSLIDDVSTQLIGVWFAAATEDIFGPNTPTVAAPPPPPVTCWYA